MKPETRRLEKRIIRKRRPLEKRGARMIFKALKAQIPEIRSIESAAEQISMISDEPIRTFFRQFYGMVGKEIGMEYFRFLQKDEDEFMQNQFLEEMERYAINEAGMRIVAINETSKKIFRQATSQAILEANEFGLGVEKTKDLIMNYMQQAIKPSRARAIAQTELITASNAASFKSANATGLTFKKFWSTSGLADVRDSHQFAEAWSIDRNGIGMDQSFDMGDGTFMKYPGDPAGTPENIINCRCTVLLEPI